MAKIASPKLIEALQAQFNAERYSADVYYALATALDNLNLVGAAAYLQARADEERGHAQAFSDYLSDRFVRPILTALADPNKVQIPADPQGAGGAAFLVALDHERLVTARIRTIFDLAFEEDDPETVAFIQPFLTEQVEEERSLDEIITRFTLGKGNGAAILLIDDDLRKRAKKDGKK